MADIKRTPIKQDFPEVKDKIVTSVEVLSDTEGFGVTIRFSDETTLDFTIESYLAVFPVHSQWKQGEETVLKRWKPIQSIESLITE